MKGIYKLALAPAVCIALGAASAEGWAQQKQKYAFKTPPGATKYEEQHAIDVGDVPGHQVRVFSVHSMYTAEAPVFDGIKVKEGWTRAATDYTEGNGHGAGYTVTLLDNGDKIFGRWEGITQTTIGADGSKVTKTNSVTSLTGGTGRFEGIHGTLRTVTTTDFKSLSDAASEGEYWIEPVAATGTSTAPAK